jgi:ElaB/YqjD/DUF883 family membrane-anchored ribosome-binding protein
LTQINEAPAAGGLSVITNVPVLRHSTSQRRFALAEHTKSSPSLEDQITQLQNDVKAIAASLTKLSEDKIAEARSSAKTQYKNLVKSGHDVADELTEQVNVYEGQLVEAIRERPLTAVAGAIGVGFLIALLSRR